MTETHPNPNKPKLLVIELWGLGDLVIATPFLQAASQKYDVTIVAKPYASDLQARFWPGVKAVPFHAPWTAFKLKDKYRLYAWPWREIFRLRKLMRGQNFDIGVSGRGESAGGDPRDHFLLAWFGVKRRIGFPRVGSQIFLTETLRRAGPEVHRYENWRVLGSAIGVELPAREELWSREQGAGSREEKGEGKAGSWEQGAGSRGQRTEGGGWTAEMGTARSKEQGAGRGGQKGDGKAESRKHEGKAESGNAGGGEQGAGSREREILVHSGAGQPVRVWPLERYRGVVARLRQKGYSVQVACDPEQLGWWHSAGEAGAIAPKTVTELLELSDRAGAFIGNDSGPGHLAAFSGVPTFTIFGPQLPEWFAPLNPSAEWVGGKACPYKPCSDYCRFAQPICLTNWMEEEIWERAESFVNRILPNA